MDRSEAFTQLASMACASDAPTLTDDELAAALVWAALPDAEGHEPAHPDWTPTYGLWPLRTSAAELWRLKAGKASARVDVSADDASIKWSQLYQHCLTMASAFAADTGSALSDGAAMPGLGGAGRSSAGLPVGNARESDTPGDLTGGPAGSWPRQARCL